MAALIIAKTPIAEFYARYLRHIEQDSAEKQSRNAVILYSLLVGIEQGVLSRDDISHKALLECEKTAVILNEYHLNESAVKESLSQLASLNFLRAERERFVPGNTLMDFLGQFNRLGGHLARTTLCGHMLRRLKSGQ